MDAKLLTDFESATGVIADVYFLAGFTAGFFVSLVFLLVLFALLDR